MKRWPRVVLPDWMPPTAKGTMSGSSVSGPKVARIVCSGRTQRRLVPATDAAPQRIDFCQGKLSMIGGRISASTSIVGRPARSITATWKSPFFGSDRTSASSSEARPALFRKPATAASGAPTFGPLRSSRASGCAAGKSAMCNASRRGVAKAAPPAENSPLAASASVTSRFRSSAACACMRAGISSQKSSRRRSGIGSVSLARTV